MDARPRAAFALIGAALFVDLALLGLVPALGGFAYQHCVLCHPSVDDGEHRVRSFEEGGESLDVHAVCSSFGCRARSPATEGRFAASISANATRTHRASCFNFNTLVSFERSPRDAA